MRKKIAAKRDSQSDIYTRLIFDYCFIYETLGEIYKIVKHFSTFIFSQG